MKRFDGERPQNARISIKYSGKMPKVSFSYPRKKGQGVTGNMLFYIFVGWIVLSIPLLYYLAISDGFDRSSDYPFKSIKEYNKSNITEYMEYYFQPERIIYYYDSSNSPYRISWNPKRLLLLFYVFVTPLIIYFPFKKKWNKLYPEFQAFLARKKYRKFTSDDLEQTKQGRFYIELPIFQNVICDFKAIKDFSKYMEEFDIREYNFKSYKLRKFRKEKRKKKPQNEFIWYARWYFNKEPKQGELEVIFK